MNATGPTVAEAVASALARHGVEVIFGQSLPSAVILAAEAIGIRQIAYRQENMGGAMADGYARISGKVAVVAAQNGPAATLLVPPLAEALKASVPSSRSSRRWSGTRRTRMRSRSSITRRSSPPAPNGQRRSPPPTVSTTMSMPRLSPPRAAGPGPAVLLLPADLLREPSEPSLVSRRASYGRWPLDRVSAGKQQVGEAARLIANASNPVVIAGGGALSEGAPEALARLQEMASLPVFTTNMGKGSVDERHPLSCGVLGSLTGPRSLGRHTRDILRDADVVLQVGTRNNQNGTDSWRLIPANARILQIDIDPQEVGRNYEAMRLVGDAAETLSALCDALRGANLAKQDRCQGNACSTHRGCVGAIRD